ncbi:NADPH-dependent FMN reductase [Metasolibacillus meyeri]|uniref:NADPH-dependent FMN reductase n=1 Tax=Metasolibacillus meyeri TaxID=1071052 RepID=UPI000D3221AB|nr:NADPH-dependent FMN reductase [Metasolibacillus meyeri]
MANIVIVNGTNSSSSRVNAVKHYIEQALRDIQVIDVYQLPAQDLLTANFNSEYIIEANKLVEEAEVVIVLTPVYKAAYSGILKTYLDLLPQKGLENKVMIPIAVGGTLHHLLAIDYALKPVLTALGATHILQGIYILDQYIQKVETGFVIEEEIITRIDHQLQLALTKVAIH